MTKTKEEVFFDFFGRASLLVLIIGLIFWGTNELAYLSKNGTDQTRLEKLEAINSCITYQVSNTPLFKIQDCIREHR